MPGLTGAQAPKHKPPNKLRTLRVNEENFYLLAETVECLVFALEKLVEQHSPEVQQNLQKPLAFARETLQRVRRKNIRKAKT